MVQAFLPTLKSQYPQRVTPVTLTTRSYRPMLAFPPPQTISMRKRTLVFVLVISMASATLGRAQETPQAVAVGPWRTGVPVHCADGRTIPANTVISGPNVTAEELCGSKSGGADNSAASGAMISNTGNPVQDMVTNSVNLYIVMHTTNPLVSGFMQGAATGFISAMFANNSAEAQRQQQLMDQEILRRKQEQERQRRIAEQQRFDAMYARLSSALKLDGVPFSLTLKNMSSSSPDSLELKGMSSSGPGELKLKLADSSPTSYGLKGLPGIYVGGPAGGDGTTTQVNAHASTTTNPNLVSGPGTGTTGPGIPGLPGIYLDGVQPRQAPQLAQAAENLTGPERALAQDTALKAAGQNPALTTPSPDPNVQNFQQANQEYQQALAANNAANEQLQAAQTHVDSDKAAIDVARAQLNAVTPSAEQQEAFNKMVAVQGNDEAVKAAADKAWDSTQVNLSTAREHAAVTLAALTPASTHVPSNVAANDSSVVDLSHTTRAQPNLLRTPTAPAPRAVQVPSVRAAAVPPVTPKLKPSVSQLCTRLSGAQTALRRLMETQNMRNQDRAQWEKAVNDSSEAAWQRGADMLREATGDLLSGHIKGLMKKNDDEIEKLYRDISAEKDPLKVGAMQKKWEQMDLNKAYLEDALRRAAVDQKHLDELTAEREYFKWTNESEGDLVGTMEGLRQIVDITLGDERVKELLTPEVAAGFKYGLSIEDSSFDILREVLAAQQIKQLNQNSEEFLRAVALLNAKIQKTVSQLNEYKATNPEGASCPLSPQEPHQLSSELK